MFGDFSNIGIPEVIMSIMSCFGSSRGQQYIFFFIPSQTCALLPVKSFIFMKDKGKGSNLWKDSPIAVE